MFLFSFSSFFFFFSFEDRSLLEIIFILTRGDEVDIWAFGGGGEVKGPDEGRCSYEQGRQVCFLILEFYCRASMRIVVQSHTSFIFVRHRTSFPFQILKMIY